MKIDCNGHSMSTKNIELTLESEVRLWKKLLSDKIAERFVEPFHVSSECFECGESPQFKTEDHGENFTAVTECVYKKGFPPIEVNLNVPSGEILLFNDFRAEYEIEKKYFSINSTSGKKQYSEHYAAQGLAIHFVGNSCPRVIQVSDDRLEIGNFWCEKEDGCQLPECPMPECNRVKELGTICTDLWWYCAVDREEFEKRIGKTTEKYQEEYHARGAWPEIIRAKVTPGLYKTVGQYHIDSERLFSFIEKIK